MSTAWLGAACVTAAVIVGSRPAWEDVPAPAASPHVANAIANVLLVIIPCSRAQRSAVSREHIGLPKAHYPSRQVYWLIGRFALPLALPLPKEKGRVLRPALSTR